MAKVGFYRIAIGVEAGSNKILKNLAKSEDISTIKKTINDACELDYEVNLFFIVGSPGETLRDLEDSFDIALNYPIGTAFFYNIIPFPNTPLFRWIEKNGKLLKKPGDYLNNYPILNNIPLFETPQMSRKERKTALRRAFGIMRKTMRRNWTRRLTKLKVLGKILAFIYTSRVTQNVILRNKFCRQLVYKLAHNVVSY
jgi:radical SAM superfamily enzyme YgiQ (UPF0313 family)